MKNTIDNDQIVQNSNTGNRMIVFATLLFLTTILGSWLRLKHIDSTMRYDESYNALYFILQGFSGVITKYDPNNHMANTILAYLSQEIFGFTPATLRIPPLVFGILMIPLASWFTYLITDKKPLAILVGLAVAVNSPLIQYSVNARGYCMQTSVMLMACIAVIYFLKKPTYKRAMIWGSICALGAYTIPTFIFPFAGICLFLTFYLTNKKSLPGHNRIEFIKKSLTGISICGTGTILLYLPTILSLGLSNMLNKSSMCYEVFNRQNESTLDSYMQIWNQWNTDSSRSGPH